MKKLNTLLIIIMTFFYGCGETSIRSVENINGNGGMIRENTGILTSFQYLHETEYKNHTYIIISVRDGYSITHAGHCVCNK